MNRTSRLLVVVAIATITIALAGHVMATTTLVLLPSDDAHTDSSEDRTNFGQISTLNVVKTTTRQQTSFLKFDLSTIDLSQLQAAVLKLKVIDGSTKTQRLNLVSDTSWNESTLTFRNQPVASSTISSITGYTTGSWIEFNVSDQVKNATNNAVSFAIDTQESDDLIFASKESPSDNPQLVIYTTNEPSPTTAPTTDINLDGTTDYTDYTQVSNDVGSTGCDHPSDINQDCRVDIFDFAGITSQLH
jgi:hypothetical protein